MYPEDTILSESQKITQTEFLKEGIIKLAHIWVSFLSPSSPVEINYSSDELLAITFIIKWDDSFVTIACNYYLDAIVTLYQLIKQERHNLFDKQIELLYSELTFDELKYLERINHNFSTSWLFHPYCEIFTRLGLIENKESSMSPFPNWGLTDEGFAVLRCFQRDSVWLEAVEGIL